MGIDLFREEALAGLRSNPRQPPLLSKPLSGMLLTTMATASVGALAAFAALFPFADKDRVSGYLTPSEGWNGWIRVPRRRRRVRHGRRALRR